MIDILNFKERSTKVDLESAYLKFIVPLEIKEVRAVVEEFKENKFYIKVLSYILNVSHFASSGNIEGLNESDLHERAVLNADLPFEFVPTKSVKDCIAFYDKRYGRGIFGLFKEINRSFETTRSTIELINGILSDAVLELKEQKNTKGNTDEDGELSLAKTLSNIKVVLDSINTVRTLSTSIPQDIEKIKDLESSIILTSDSGIELYGGGRIPDSAK